MTMSQKAIMAATEKYVMSTYARFPIALVRGRGSRVWDADGVEYIDFLAGIAVNVLGHGHPAVVRAIREQSEKLIHVSNLYHIESQSRLAQLLVENSFGDKCFFCNSGAEANEAAIKLARKFAKDRGEPERFEIICMKGSFHGRTLATITATGQEKYHKGFEPLVPGFRHVAFNDLAAVEAAVSDRTCAILVEPVQGEGGVHIAEPSYLPALRDLCDRTGALLIYDEVQCGIGRTGKLFAYENFDAPPHIMTLAKGLAGGVPIGAMVAREDVAQSFTPGTHASTFGGNPLACAAAVAVLETILAPGFLDGVSARGDYLKRGFERLRKSHPVIEEIRSLGLMAGVELTVPCGDMVRQCMEKGALVNCTMDNVLRVLPPLIIEEGEIDRLLEILDGLFP